jgi:DNA-binding beta-propeller fold protein YncE
MKVIKILSIAVLITMSISCSPKIGKAVTQSNIFYPQYTDTAHFQFLTAISHSKQIEKQSNFQKAIVGESQVEFIIKPYGISTSGNKIYVSDIGLKGVNIIDLENKQFEQFKPIRNKFEFTLTNDVDEQGNHYFVDARHSKVFIYDSNFNFVKEFDVPENNRPVRIRIKNDKMYIADIPTGKLNIYDKSTGEFIESLPRTDSKEDDAYVYMAMDFAFFEDYIYILDAGHFRVKKFKLTGEYVDYFGEQGTGYGQFYRPKSIAVDKEGNIFVADASYHNVQMFNEDYVPLMAFGHPQKRDDGKLTVGIRNPTSMVITYGLNKYFEKFVDAKYNLKYVLLVVNQIGANSLQIYGRLEIK